MSTPESSEESELECFCGLPAKLRVSHTPKNLYRLFYNCPKGISNQCGFFQWSDEPSPTGDRHEDELNLIRDECIQLQERLNEIQHEHDSEKADWDREKSELTSELSSVQAELEDIKNKIKVANELELMPPIDKLTISNGDADDALIKHVIYAI